MLIASETLTNAQKKEKTIPKQGRIMLSVRSPDLRVRELETARGDLFGFLLFGLRFRTAFGGRLPLWHAGVFDLDTGCAHLVFDCDP